MGAVGRMAVAPPRLILNQLTAGGVREQRDDWTQAARATTRATVLSLRPDRMVVLEESALTPELSTELAEIQALYQTIDLNLALFGNPQVALPTLGGRFDFSVGSIDRLCDAAGADALLLIYGEDDYFTGDRKALAALGIVAAAFTGVALQPSNGRSRLSAALVARDGTLLWSDVLGPGMVGDLRRPDGVQNTIRTLLRGLPPARGPVEPVP